MAVRSRRRVRRTSSDWCEIISRFGRSGLSVETFCAREGVSTSSFRRWREKLTPKKTIEPDSFVEVGVPAATLEPSPWSVEVELPGNILLRVRG